MADNKEEKKLRPPYLSYRTFDNFIQRLKTNGIPSKIDRSILGSFSGSIQILVLTSLRYLNLTNDQGDPTEKLDKLVNSEEADRKKILREILTASYSFLFKEKNLNKITFAQIQKYFEEAGTQGDTTRKSMRFFMAAAQDAGLELSPYLKKVRASAPRRAGFKSKIKREERQNENQAKEEVLPHEQSGSSDWQQILLSKFPTFDPAWPDEVKKEWFAAFSKLMEEFKK